MHSKIHVAGDVLSGSVAQCRRVRADPMSTRGGRGDALWTLCRSCFYLCCSYSRSVRTIDEARVENGGMWATPSQQRGHKHAIFGTSSKRVSPPPSACSWGSHVHCDTGPPMRASSATSIRERISCGRGGHSLDHDLASSPRLESQGTTRRPERALELALGPRSARLAILKFALPVALILFLWSGWLSENAINKIKCS